MRKMDLVLLVTLIAGVSLVANRGIQAGEDRTATASPPQAPLVVEGTNCKANLKSIATSLEMYATDHGGRYPSSLMELVPKYLPAIPRCPLSDHDTYLEGYSIKSRPDWYLVYCRGDAHAKDGLAADFPRFSSDKGPEPLTQDELPSCQDSLKNLATALEMYSTDNAGRYPTSLQQLMPNYLLRPPVCKVAGLDTYSRAYAVAQRPDAFTCICEGEHHHGEGLEPNFPQYSSTTGLIEK
jgi:hypothetical protein